MSFRNTDLEADEHGCIDLTPFDPEFTDALVPVLLSHGFAAVEGEDPDAPPAPDPIDMMKRQDLFAFIRSHGGSAHIGLRNDELRPLARSLIKP